VKKFIFVLISITVAVSLKLSAQTINPIVTRAAVMLGDTIPIVDLREVEILSLKIPKTERERKYNARLIRNIKKVYPFAKLAGIKLRQYDILLSKVKTDKERKQLMKKAEKEIKDQYGESLKNLTFSQGKILIKLIDRETQNTSYDIVKDLRGNFTAFFYQAFARLWGYNLKTKYNPEGEDKKIETIVKMIDAGRL
jgi:hypothetical protein